MSQAREYVPGMREQAKGIKLYVEHEFAPLKACIVGNTSSLYMVDPDLPWNANAVRYFTKEAVNYMRQNKGRPMRDVDPKTYEQLTKEMDGLAETYRQAGVKVIRNESGKVPDAILKHYGDWCPDKFQGVLAQGLGEVVGNCFIAGCEFWAAIPMQLEYYEALLEIFENSKDAVWLQQPPLFPDTAGLGVGPVTSPGDYRVFPNKTVLFSIGVADPSHIQDRSKPRSSGNELGAELIRRMLAPYGWKVEVIYHNSRLSFHIDCLIALVDVGIIGLPDNALWTPLPKQFQDWDIIRIDPEEAEMRVCNTVPLGNKKVAMVQGAKTFARELEKRGYTPVEVPYGTANRLFESGIHCSTCALWREYD